MKVNHLKRIKMVKEYLIQYTGVFGEVLEQDVTGLKYVAGSEGWGAFRVKCTEKELEQMEKEWNQLSGFFVKEIQDLSICLISIKLYQNNPDKPSLFKLYDYYNFHTDKFKYVTISQIVEFLKDAGNNSYEDEDYKRFLISEEKEFFAWVNTEKLLEFLNKENTFKKDYFNNF
tara:strand:+ start:1036 stop:1554 length:519 start_codon:yes stop_codon:yes gene_type:complete